MQTEKDEKTGNVAKLRIKWIDDCNYELKFIESTFNFPDSILQLQKAEILKTKIVGGTDDYYLFESKSNILKNVLKDTMWIKK